MTEQRWDDFRVFLQVAKMASIKKAAAELNTTQSAISKRIDRLERTLGVRLFERGYSGTTLTLQGQIVLSHALTAESAIERAARSAEQTESRISGDCSIQMADGIANYWLAPFLPAFLDRYPDIELKIMMDSGGAPERPELFDIRVHYDPPGDSSLIAKPLGTIHVMPFASKAYIARHGMPNSIADLADHRLLDQARYLVSKGSWSTWLTSAPLKHTSLFTNQSVFLGTVVQRGGGITLMPTYLSTYDPDLVPIDIGMRFSLRLYVSYSREKAAKAAVRIVVDHVREHVFDLKNMPWFGDEFLLPDARWKDMQQAAVARASLPLTLAAQ